MRITYAPAACYGYARSLADDEPDQEQLIRAKADTIDLEWVHCRSDKHTSVKETPWDDNHRRPEFGKLLRELQPGDHLIVWRLDRLDQRVARALDCAERLVSDSVCLHVLDFAGLALQLQGDSGSTLLAVARALTRLIAADKRCKSQQERQQRKTGAISREPGPGKRRDFLAAGGYADVWDPEQCRIARYAWRRWAHDGWPLKALARELRTLGWRRWDGALWRWHEQFRRLVWRYAAMLALGQDLNGLPAAPAETRLAQTLLGRAYQQQRNLPGPLQFHCERDTLTAMAKQPPGAGKTRP